MNKTTEQSLAYAGVDISKDVLDVSLVGRAPDRHDNNAAGIGGFIKLLEKMPGPVHVICEPSGGYERDLLEALWAAGIPVSLVNAARVRSFARAQGLLAKTDKIDASVLREFGELLQPEVLEAPAPARQRLAALVQRREQLVNLLTMEEQRLAQTRDVVLKKLTQSLIKELQKQVKQIEAMIEEQIDDDDTLRGRAHGCNRSKASAKSPPPPSSRSCPNWENSAARRSAHSLASHLTIAIAVRFEVVARSAAAA